MSQTLDRNQEYMVRNYNPSPVAISTRDAQYLIPGGTRHAPAEFPMTLSEIIYVNSVSEIFKVGVLFFEEAFEEEIYAALRITNWRDILRADDIDDIILHPTTEKLQRLIAIKHHMYFDRVYGEYMCLRQSGLAISGSVDQVIRLRQAELHKGIINSEIKISKVDDAAQRQAETDAKMQAMQDEIAALKALLAAQTAPPPSAPAEPPKPKTQKPAAKTASRSTSAKGTEVKKKPEG